MKKLHAVFMIFVLCAVSSLPLVTHAQSQVAEQHRAEISYPIKFDKTPKPLREMFDNGERQKPARGGKDFEPGRPEPVGNQNRETIDRIFAAIGKHQGEPERSLAELHGASGGFEVTSALLNALRR